MRSDPDFSFRIGKSSCLEGRGWRGLIALALLLGVALVLATLFPGVFNLVLNHLSL